MPFYNALSVIHDENTGILKSNMLYVINVLNKYIQF